MNEEDKIDISNLLTYAQSLKQSFGGDWDSSLQGNSPENYKHSVTVADRTIVYTEGHTREESWVCDYIAELSPNNVIQLLKRLERAEASEARLRKQLSWLGKTVDVIINGE